MRQIFLAGLAMLAVLPASATVNLEYGQEYEQAYLDQCVVSNTERACRCAMETLQTRIGFWDFAEKVAAYPHRAVDRSELRDLTHDILARCTAIGRAE